MAILARYSCLWRLRYPFFLQEYWHEAPHSRAGRLPVSSMAWLGWKFLYSSFHHLVEWGPWDYSGTAVVWCGAWVPVPFLSASTPLPSLLLHPSSLFPCPFAGALGLCWPRTLALFPPWSLKSWACSEQDLCALYSVPLMGPASTPASITVVPSARRFSMHFSNKR